MLSVTRINIILSYIVIDLTARPQLLYIALLKRLTSAFFLEICALLRCYAPLGGNPLPTFRDNVSVLSSRVKKSNEAGSLSNLWTQRKVASP
jgi:hypothetical protein